MAAIGFFVEWGLELGETTVEGAWVDAENDAATIRIDNAGRRS